MTRYNEVEEDFEGLVFDVTFTYPTDTEPMLKDISFEVKPGEMIMLSERERGKSTGPAHSTSFDPLRLAPSKLVRRLASIRSFAEKNVSIVLQKLFYLRERIGGQFVKESKDASLPN